MYSTVLERPTGPADGQPQWWLAAETVTAYDPRPTPPRPVGEVVADVDRLLDELAGVDFDAEADRDLLDAAVALQHVANRVAGAQYRVLGEADARDAYQHDGAVTLASWYRARTNHDHGEARRQCAAGRRLRRLPALAASVQAGRVTPRHVTAVTEAAVGARLEAITEVEDTLVDLAERATPREVSQVVKRVFDLVDPDGNDRPPPADERNNDLRYLHLYPALHGMWRLDALMNQLDAEALLTFLQAHSRPDPADTPPAKQRTPAQQRLDALIDGIRAALGRPDTPTIAGSPAMIVGSVDLLSLLGLDSGCQCETRTPRLRFTGDVDLATLRKLALHAKMMVLTTMGPWRVVNIGRSMRTIPAWMRMVLEVIHRHCRGPDCDRPIPWTDAHHVEQWLIPTSDTDLNLTVPACRAHHQMVTAGDWNLRFNLDTGECTWTGPDGQTIIVPPPTP